MSFTDSMSVMQPLLHPGMYYEAGEQGKKLVDPVFETSRFGTQPPLHTAAAGKLTQRALAAGRGSPRIARQALQRKVDTAQGETAIPSDDGSGRSTKIEPTDGASAEEPSK